VTSPLTERNEQERKMLNTSFEGQVMRGFEEDSSLVGGGIGKNNQRTKKVE